MAPDKVTHAMVVDLETGLAEDGTILARRARLLLDCGAYASDTPVLGQVAAMMIAGPVPDPATSTSRRSCVYTNRTPSGSVRAPTGPQACWAVEQHHDVLAARLGLDPVEFRRRNLVRDGDEGPTRQTARGRRRDRRARRRRSSGSPPASRSGGTRRSASRRAGGSALPAPSGAFVRIESDGSRTDRDRGPGERDRRGHGPADPRRRGARDAARGLRDHLPGHRCRSVRRRQLGQPDDVQQRPRRRRGRPRGARASSSSSPSVALEASVADLELRDGHASASRAARTGGSSIAELAATAHDGALLLARGSGMPPDPPGARRLGLRRPARVRVVRGADLLLPCGPGPGRSGDRRSSGCSRSSPRRMSGGSSTRRAPRAR